MTTIAQAARKYAAKAIATTDPAIRLAELYRAQGALEFAALFDDSFELYNDEQRVALLIVQAKRGNNTVTYPYDDFHGSWGDDDR